MTELAYRQGYEDRAHERDYEVLTAIKGREAGR